MYAKAMIFFANLSLAKVLAYGILLAVVIEAGTIGLRYGIDMQSTRDTGFIATCTCGIRIHHGYIGVLLIPLAWCFPLGQRHALWIAAVGLILSDLAHHFLVLWPIEGSPQFDLVYPQHPYWKQPE